MNLQNIKGEKALDVLADIIEPATTIIADKEIGEMMRGGKTIKAMSRALKEYKPQVVEILAALAGETPEEYKQKITVLSLPVALLRLFNDPDVAELLFQSQAQTVGATSSGPATENTEDHEN